MFSVFSCFNRLVVWRSWTVLVKVYVSSTFVRTFFVGALIIDRLLGPNIMFIKTSNLTFSYSTKSSYSLFRASISYLNSFSLSNYFDLCSESYNSFDLNYSKESFNYLSVFSSFLLISSLSLAINSDFYSINAFYFSNSVIFCRL